VPDSDAPPGPRLRRYLDQYAYGWLLLLIGASLAFQLGAADAGWSQAVTIVLQGLTLVAALRISGARPWLIRLAAIAAAVATLGALGVLIGSGDLDDAAARVVGLMLVLLAPVAIVHGIVRQVRDSGGITIRTMFGVLCVYLLVGMAFGFAYGLIQALGNDPVFAQAGGADQADFLYFSFATLTTTGWGDLTAATDLARAFAVTEALAGQIYLVTVVAVIVANLGRRRPLARS
jgi:hypothetical protein